MKWQIGITSFSERSVRFILNLSVFVMRTLTVINLCGLPTSQIDSQQEIKGESIGKQSICQSHKEQSFKPDLKY